jgi:hypothetical protein
MKNVEVSVLASAQRNDHKHDLLTARCRPKEEDNPFSTPIIK